MTVQELIEQLQKQKLTAEVVISLSDMPLIGYPIKKVETTDFLSSIDGITQVVSIQGE